MAENSEKATEEVELSTENSSGDADQPKQENGENVNGESTEKDESGDAKSEEKGEGGLINATEDNELKMFVGGLSWDTETFGLKDYFQKFGKVTDCTIKKDGKSERSRGFGFVLFAEKESVEKVLKQKEHHLDGRKIDPKRAQAIRKEGKMFVGGIKSETENDTVKAYFSKYGEIESYERPTDKTTGKNRGFCFITFKKDGCIKECTSTKYHELDGNKVDVKEAQHQTERAGRGGGFMRGGGYQMRGGGGWGGPPGGYAGYGYPAYDPGFAGYGGYGAYGGYGNYGGFHQGGYGGGKTVKGRGDSGRSAGGWGTRTHTNHTNWQQQGNRGHFHGAYQGYHDY